MRIPYQRPKIYRHIVVMATSSRSLLAALSNAGIARDFVHLAESCLDQPLPGQFCNVCVLLDVCIDHFESLQQPQLKERMQSISDSGAESIRDFDLGRRSDLLARSSSCLTCSALLSCADEHIGTLFDERLLGFETDYTFSAHIMEDNPILAITFGTTSIMNVSARERRLCGSQLAVVRFLSTDSKLPMNPSPWPCGTPRLYDPMQLDPRQIKAWFDRCQQDHGAKCRQPKAQYVTCDVRPSFVDVEKLCIATPDGDVPYVALSYVWGPVETLQATKENIDSLRCPGALSSSRTHPVPATIRDAIDLCALVGQRYLWVDRVCIVQNDFDTKRGHLSAMAQTYAKAEFTIVAADGSHADQGLSGLGQGSKQRQRHLVQFPTKTRKKLSEEISRRERLSENVWSSRAWTFQEHVFSRRLLYMDTLMSWICYSATWNEAWSLPHTTLSIEDERQDQHGMGEKLHTVDWPSFAEYANMVEQYNSRHLTFDSDILNAFLGVMTQMREGFPAGFHGGFARVLLHDWLTLAAW